MFCVTLLSFTSTGKSSSVFVLVGLDFGNGTGSISSSSLISSSIFIPNSCSIFSFNNFKSPSES